MGMIRVGICSWTERSLVQDSNFYPKWVRTAEDRLRYYASQFSVVEADASFYRLPRAEIAARWVERTPARFTFNVKAFRAFSLHPCGIDSLPLDLRQELPGNTGEKRFYWNDLPEVVQTELLAQFGDAQRPLHRAGKLGAILVQFPKWIFPNQEVRDHLVLLRRAWPEYRIAVEFRDVSWVSEKNLDRTMAFLADHDFTYVCVDEPRLARTVPPIVEVTTTGLAMVRFHGRNAETWNRAVASAAERFRYLYREDELREWLPKLRSLSECAEQTHAMLNNCYRDFAMRNAAQLIQLLSRDTSEVVQSSADGSLRGTASRQSGHQTLVGRTA